jgi:hypothetical protein
MPSALKVYVWDKFAPDYTNGLAFAVAFDMPEAMEAVRRELIASGLHSYEPQWGPVSVYDVTELPAAACTGGG